MELDLDRLEKLAMAAAAGPWQECGHDSGGCSCGFVYAIPADFPVATVTNGDWGDSWPALRQFHPDADPEAYTATSVYGHVSDSLGKANAAFIAAANPQTLLALLDLIRFPPVNAMAEPDVDDLIMSLRARADGLSKRAAERIEAADAAVVRLTKRVNDLKNELVVHENAHRPIKPSTDDCEALMRELKLTPTQGCIAVGSGQFYVYIFRSVSQPTMTEFRSFPVVFRIGGGMPKAL